MKWTSKFNSLIKQKTQIRRKNAHSPYLEEHWCVQLTYFHIERSNLGSRQVLTQWRGLSYDNQIKIPHLASHTKMERKKSSQCHSPKEKWIIYIETRVLMTSVANLERIEVLRGRVQEKTDCMINPQERGDWTIALVDLLEKEVVLTLKESDTEGLAPLEEPLIEEIGVGLGLLGRETVLDRKGGQGEWLLEMEEVAICIKVGLLSWEKKVCLQVTWIDVDLILAV